MPGHALTSITDHDHLLRELRDVLASCQELIARHHAALAAYLDAEGEVIEEKYPEYDDTRISTAIEASDHLHDVMIRLAVLVVPPTPRAFTLTFAGHERHIGEAPTSFVINATSLDDAALILVGLPSWHEWYLAEAAGDGGADIVYLPEQSHPGLPTLGEFADLRAEQRSGTSQHASAVPNSPRSAAPVTSPRPTPAPANPAARTPH
ncbi:hypothetical protein AQI95_29165 [Streptomyces yokosukanensis]|uniref:Uncharacterized protein n=1 Tax=Streptomyces yokosukanensis TaxID=67386 RepID=A0A124HEX8_9ACTN|nr:hypothetical protein [Streptomyces yokosukanensis]KUN02142.1 hypothetical protein AQI95_29165 [Streptomyces yokosukanensis]